MICKRCGAWNPENSSYCSLCLKAFKPKQKESVKLGKRPECDPKRLSDLRSFTDQDMQRWNPRSYVILGTIFQLGFGIYMTAVFLSIPGRGSIFLSIFPWLLFLMSTITMSVSQFNRIKSNERENAYWAKKRIDGKETHVIPKNYFPQELFLTQITGVSQTSFFMTFVGTAALGSFAATGIVIAAQAFTFYAFRYAAEIFYLAHESAKRGLYISPLGIIAGTVRNSYMIDWYNVESITIDEANPNIVWIDLLNYTQMSPIEVSPPAQRYGYQKKSIEAWQISSSVTSPTVMVKSVPIRAELLMGSNLEILGSLSFYLENPSARRRLMPYSKFRSSFESVKRYLELSHPKTYALFYKESL